MVADRSGLQAAQTRALEPRGAADQWLLSTIFQKHTAILQLELSHFAPPFAYSFSLGHTAVSAALHPQYARAHPDAALDTTPMYKSQCLDYLIDATCGTMVT